jgi:hypothetical protein
MLGGGIPPARCENALEWHLEGAFTREGGFRAASIRQGACNSISLSEVPYPVWGGGLSRCAEFEPAVMESARKLLNTAKTVREMRTAQAILLPAIFGLIREQNATAIGLSVSRIGGIQEMGAFLQQVGARYPDDHILMLVDGASSHTAKALQIPDSISLVLLPAYPPQLNPQEIVRDEVREKNFPDRVFSTMAAVHEQLQAALAKSVADTKGVTSLTAWPWTRKVLP